MGPNLRDIRSPANVSHINYSDLSKGTIMPACSPATHELEQHVASYTSSNGNHHMLFVFDTWVRSTHLFSWRHYACKSQNEVELEPVGEEPFLNRDMRDPACERCGIKKKSATLVAASAWVSSEWYNGSKASRVRFHKRKSVENLKTSFGKHSGNNRAEKATKKSFTVFFPD